MGSCQSGFRSGPAVPPPPQCARAPFFHVLSPLAVVCLSESSHPGGCLVVVLIYKRLQFCFLRSLFQMWLLIFIVFFFFARFSLFSGFYLKKKKHLIHVIARRNSDYTFCFRDAVTRDCAVPCGAAGEPRPFWVWSLRCAYCCCPGPLVPADTSFRSSFFILSIWLKFVEFRIWDAFWEPCVCWWRS